MGASTRPVADGARPLLVAVVVLLLLAFGSSMVQLRVAQQHVHHRPTGGSVFRNVTERTGTETVLQQPDDTAAPTVAVTNRPTATALKTTQRPTSKVHVTAASGSPYVMAAFEAARLLGVAAVVIDSLPNASFWDVLRTEAPSTCSGKVSKRVEFTHRRARPKELSTAALYKVLRTSASTAWEAHALATPSMVVGEKPVCFTPGADLSKPFGSWSASYVDTTEVVQHGLQKAPQVHTAEPPPLLAAFAPGFFASGYSVSCDGTAFSAGGCLWELKAPKPMEWDRKRIAVAVALCDDWCKGYYHFTHEHLPRVAVAHAVLANGDAVLALPAAMNGFQRQFFVDILGIKHVHVGPVAADVLLHPGPMRCGNTFSGMLHLFREVVARRLSLELHAPIPGKLRVLFAERSKGSRMARNYAAVKAAVIDMLGTSATINTTKGSEHAATQVALFNDADIVIGPHGANLANTMFMRPGRHVIEMASLKKGNMCYYTTAVRLGLKYHLVPHFNGKDASYELDPAVVVKHVQHAVDNLQAER